MVCPLFTMEDHFKNIKSWAKAHPNHQNNNNNKGGGGGQKKKKGDENDHGLSPLQEFLLLNSSLANHYLFHISGIVFNNF